MKEINKKILKEASILLIITSMILSTVVVTADLRQDTKSIEKATERFFSDFDRSSKDGIIEQGQIFYEDFDTGTWPSEGFPIIDSDFGSDETWVLGSTEYHTSPYSAEVWWAYPPPDQSEWLISEEITIDDVAELEFYSYVYLGSPEGDEFKVKISPTGSTNHEDFITLWDATNDYPVNTGWHYFTDPAITIDLGAYNGTVRIAFHADGTTSVDGGLWYIWLVDTVSINYREPIADLDCEGELSWEDVIPGDTVEGSFTVSNIGEPDSLLNWEVKDWPDWGNWTFDPESGTGLPEGDSITIDVEVVAPDNESTEFTGEIILVNSNDPDDTCTIPVELITPYNLDIGRVWLRGWLFRCNHVGNVNNALALRLHYIEFTPTERTAGMVMMNRVSFKDSAYLGRMYESGLGLLTYVIGFFQGGLEIL